MEPDAQPVSEPRVDQPTPNQSAIAKSSSMVPPRKLWLPLSAGLVLGLIIAVWMLVTQIQESKTQSLIPVQVTESEQQSDSFQNQNGLRQLRSRELEMQLTFPTAWDEPVTTRSNNQASILLDNRIRVTRGPVVSQLVQKELTLGELLLEEQLPGKVSLAYTYTLNDWEGKKFIYTDEQNQVKVRILVSATPQSTDIVRIEYPLPSDNQEEAVILDMLQALVIESTQVTPSEQSEDPGEENSGDEPTDVSPVSNPTGV